MTEPQLIHLLAEAIRAAVPGRASVALASGGRDFDPTLSLTSEDAREVARDVLRDLRAAGVRGIGA